MFGHKRTLVATAALGGLVIATALAFAGASRWNGASTSRAGESGAAGVTLHVVSALAGAAETTIEVEIRGRPDLPSLVHSFARPTLTDSVGAHHDALRASEIGLRRYEVVFEAVPPGRLA